MERKATMRDKKEDILKAYEELLAKSNEKEDTAKGAEDKEVEVKKVAEKTIMEKPSTYTVEGIVKGLADLKLDLSKTITDLSDKLVAEADKLETIKQAIAIESKNLEDIHDIKVTAETLDALFRTHDEKKKAFEEEMAIMGGQWKKEQEEHELAVKEMDANLKKEREREAEEYTYNLALSRKKDKDAYEDEKAALKRALKEEREAQEKKLAEREAAVAVQEAEIAELRVKVENIPVEMEKAVEKAKKDAIALTEREAKQKAELLAKDVEGEKKIAEFKIKTLEENVSKQASQIEALTKQLNDATAQVQQIAGKVIEGASGLKALSAVNEIALEQAKNVSSKK